MRGSQVAQLLLVLLLISVGVTLLRSRHLEHCEDGVDSTTTVGCPAFTSTAIRLKDCPAFTGPTSAPKPILCGRTRDHLELPEFSAAQFTSGL